MSEMVEQVAKAQAGKRWESFDEEQKEAARELARIAIEAMREPTEEMLGAEEVHPSCHMCGGPLEGWHNMIDEALMVRGPLRPAGSADEFGVERAEE